VVSVDVVTNSEVLKGTRLGTVMVWVSTETVVMMFVISGGGTRRAAFVVGEKVVVALM